MMIHSRKQARDTVAGVAPCLGSWVAHQTGIGARFPKEHRFVMVLWVYGECGGRLVKFYNILRLHVYILSVELNNLRWVRESLHSWVVLTLTNCWSAFGQYNKRTSNRHIRRDTCKLYRGFVSLGRFLGVIRHYTVG